MWLCVCMCACAKHTTSTKKGLGLKAGWNQRKWEGRENSKVVLWKQTLSVIYVKTSWLTTLSILLSKYRMRRLLSKESLEFYGCEKLWLESLANKSAAVSIIKNTKPVTFMYLLRIQVKTGISIYFIR